MSDHTPHYRAPGWFTRNIANRLIAGLTRLGVSVWGSRVLEVPGRSTGQPRQVPVNLLTFEGSQYLVSARGEGQWVRNVRAADGNLSLLVGRHRDDMHAVELTDDQKVPVLRAYLHRWKAEVGAFFDGVGPDSSDEEIQAIAAKHPGLRAGAQVIDSALPPVPPQSARVAEIVTAADALVRSDGFEALTMRRLSESLGIQAPSLYKHLPNKAAVRAALVERALRDLGSQLHGAIRTAPAADRVRDLLHCYRAYAGRDPHLYRLGTSGELDRAGLPEGLEAWAGEPFFLATGEAYLAQALWAAAHGAAILELDNRYLPGSDLDRTWAALAAAFTPATARSATDE